MPERYENGTGCLRSAYGLSVFGENTENTVSPLDKWLPHGYGTRLYNIQCMSFWRSLFILLRHLLTKIKPSNRQFSIVYQAASVRRSAGHRLAIICRSRSTRQWSAHQTGRSIDEQPLLRVSITKRDTSQQAELFAVGWDRKLGNFRSSARFLGSACRTVTIWRFPSQWHSLGV